MQQSSDEGFLASTPKLTLWAACFLLLAKFTGLVGVAIMWFVPRWVAGSTFGLAFVFVSLAIGFSYTEMRRQNKQDEEEQELIDELLDNGLLEEQLRSRGYVLHKNTSAAYRV